MSINLNFKTIDDLINHVIMENQKLPSRFVDSLPVIDYYFCKSCNTYGIKNSVYCNSCGKEY